MHASPELTAPARTGSRSIRAFQQATRCGPGSAAGSFAPQVKALDPEKGFETVAKYAERWLADREGRVHSIRDDRGRMRDYVLSMLGALDVRTFTRDDVERLRDGLDSKIVGGQLAWKTAANIWTLVTSMCDEMVNAKRRELRVRSDNPCKDVRPPDRGATKAKQFLYPTEFVQFVSCEGIPLRWRRAVALAVFSFVRDGELRVLRWEAGDVDLEHGVLSSTRAHDRRALKGGDHEKTTKSGETRRFAIESNLLPLLQTMRKESKGKGLVIALPSERAMARNLRRWLWKAGVTRPELHEGSSTRRMLRWHDLRAAGITWMAVRGDAPQLIQSRAGHTDFATTLAYVRAAEAIAGGFGEVFPSQPDCLIGGIASSKRQMTIFSAATSQKTSSNERGGRDSNPRPPA